MSDFYPAISYWIVARSRKDDEYVYPGFGFVVLGDEVPPGTAKERVIFSADGSTYDPDEYQELAAALMKVGLEPGRLPDWRGRVARGSF